MDARLIEMLRLFAANPQKSFVGGGPKLNPLAWDRGEKSRTFEVFGTALAIRDYRFPLLTEVPGTSSEVTAFPGGEYDRGMDGIVIAWGNQVLTTPTQAKDVVSKGPAGSARLLFVQAKMSNIIDAADVDQFGNNVQGFLTSPQFLQAKTSEAVSLHRRVYDSLVAATGTNVRSLVASITLAFVFHGARGNYATVVQSRERVLQNLSNAMPTARFALEIWDCEDLLQAAMAAGIALKRTLRDVRLLAFPPRTAAPGFICVAAGKSILDAFSSPSNLADSGGSSLDPNFFLENPRHDLGSQRADNVGAHALSQTIQSGKQHEVLLCHNGITIVSRGAEPSKDGTQLEVVTPQVVNGCQSSYALDRLRGKLDGSDFVVKVAIINGKDERENDTLKEAIILASNTQEEIDEWDLLARHRVVRELEREFDRNWANRLWLERRWRWRDVWEAAGVPVYDQQILTPRQLMDGFAAAILQLPHVAQGGPKPLLQRVRAGEIFSGDHEPTLYRAIGWLIVAGRIWAQRKRLHWSDLPGERGGYWARHQFVYALWRLADSRPDDVAPGQLVRSRGTQGRFEAIISALASKDTRDRCTDLAARAVEQANDRAPRVADELVRIGKVKKADQRNRDERQWFTRLVQEEADKLRG